MGRTVMVILLVGLLSTSARGQSREAERLVGKLGEHVGFDYADAESALVRMGEPAVPALTAALREPDVILRVRATRVLGEIGANAGVAYPALIQALNDDVLVVVAEAEKGLERIGEPAVPLLVEELKRPEVRRRRMALSALRRMGPAGKPAIPLIVRALEHETSTSARALAVQALDRIDSTDPQAQEGLLRALRDDSPVRKQASKALENSGLDLSSRWWVVPCVHWRGLLAGGCGALLWLISGWRRARRRPAGSRGRAARFAWVATPPVLLIGAPTYYALTREWAQPFVPQVPTLASPLVAVLGSVTLCVLLVAAAICWRQPEESA